MSSLQRGDKVRLDILLVEKGLCESRARAQAEILAGRVFIRESNQFKAGSLVSSQEPVEIRESSPWVGRGALKLDHAIQVFNIETEGRVAIDVGSSTGGFTQVLLERGARLVYAVDSGSAQLHWKLRQDDRVVVRENTNARFLEPGMFDPRPNLAVMDVSFISVTLLLPVLTTILEGRYDIICLIKPQFELEPQWVSKGGFVQPRYRQRAIEKVSDFARQIGLNVSPVIESPILGAKSANVEYLVHLKPVN